MNQLYEDIKNKKQLLVIGLFIWLPMLILPWIFQRDTHPDISSHIRFLLGVPLLILSAPVMIRTLRKVLVHFEKRQLLNEEDHKRLRDIIEKTINFQHTKVFKPIMLLFIISFFLEDFFIHSHGLHNSWRDLEHAESIWFHFVAQPFYWYVQLLFVIRLFGWWRIMFKASRMDLKIRASNGDKMGGLSFLSTSLHAFFYPVIAISITAVAGCINLIETHQLNILSLKYTFILFALIVLILVTGPLLCFYPILLKKKKSAIFKYNQLSMKQLKTLEEKWFSKNYAYTDADILSAPDFSVAEDAEALVERVNGMRLIPINKFDLVIIVVAIIIPFLPLIMIYASWKEVLQRLFNFIL